MVSLCLLLSAIIGFAAGTWLSQRQEVLAVDLARTRDQLKTLENEHKQLKVQGEDLQKKYAQLMEQHRAIIEERAQLAAENEAVQETTKSQVVSLTEEKQRLLSETNRLTELIQEHHTQRKLLEQELEHLQKTNEKMVLQRDTIQKQLAKTEHRTKGNELRAQLLEKEKKLQEQKKLLQTNEKKAQALKEQAHKADSELEKLRARQKQLQQEYVSLVGEKDQLTKQVDTVPQSVARMAKQHERLLRETAAMHYNLGVLFSQQKDYARSVNEFKKVIELRPDDADTHYNLGVIYAEHIPDQKKALDYFRKYLKLNPTAQDASWVKQYIATWQAWEGKERLD